MIKITEVFGVMAFYRILIVCALVFGLANCRKKSEAVGKEIREAGYEMTQEGWFRAVGDNDVSVMRKMSEGGFDTKTQDAEGNGAMHVAAAAGAKDAAEFLLNKGFAIDEKGAKGRTALMAAVAADRPEMVQWLLRQGADPKLKDDEGFMALMLAATSGGEGSVGELAPYHREDLDSALLLASLVGQAGVIDALTNYGASVYARMEDGRTPLMLAAQNGHREAAALLIDIGASRFATLESGDTAQTLAVAAGYAEIAELIEKGFSGDALALETDEEIAGQMGDYLDENQADTAEGTLAVNEGNAGDAGDDSLAANDSVAADAAPWNKPVTGQGGGNFDHPPGEDGSAEGADTGQRSKVTKAGPAATAETRIGAAAGLVVRTKEPVKSLAGATVSGATRSRLPETEASGGSEPTAQSPFEARAPVENLPLVMRHFRQRELPVEVKKVSGGVASLRLAGAQPKEIQIGQGESIPGSDLVVVRVFSRMEQGKLNDGAATEIGVVEVEDTASGQRREWLEGRPASGHDPVALVEDAATGERYLAKPGQRFRSEDGREFIVNDVRPGQLVIEDASSGEVRTLRLRGPRG